MSLKFIYLDETGLDENTDVFVMVGLLIDAYSLRRITQEFDDLIGGFITNHGGKIQEVKTTSLFKPKGWWGNVNISDKQDYLSRVINLVIDNTEIYSIAISKNCFDKNNALPAEIKKNYWLIAALYIASLVQKKMRKLEKNKGNTVMVFDNNAKDVPKISDSLYAPNPWFDDLYQSSISSPRKKKPKEVKPEERFNQIINTAFSIKSQHSYIIQAADAVCHILRRHIELQSTGKEKWSGEKDQMTQLANSIILKKIKLGQSLAESPCLKYYKSIIYHGWRL